MKKRLLLLEILHKLLIGDQAVEADPAAPSTTANDWEGLPSAPPPQASQPVPAPPPPQRAIEAGPALQRESFPAVSEEIRDLLRSADWEEVNQGLELLAASYGADQLNQFGRLVDAAHLQIHDLALWQAVLGISETHTLNATTKLAGLSGSLSDVRSITLNQAAFADPEIQLNLALLAEAESLEELVLNGVAVCGLGALGGFSRLRKLVLVSDTIEWDSDDHAACLADLTELRFLTVSSWPWEDLSPLAECSSLEHLDLRGGELESLDGIAGLSSLRSLALADFYSLSSLDDLENLSQLQHLSLRSLSIDAINTVGELTNLQSFVLEASESIDLSPLGDLSALQSIDVDCSEVSGLGALAGCSSLKRLKLSSIPDFPCGEVSRGRFGSAEFNKLMTTWKDVRIRSSKVSNNCAETNDLGVFLLGLNLLECVSAQISVEQFRQRLEQLNLHHGDQLRQRCYWPVVGPASTGFSRSHPVGQWIERAQRIGSINNAFGAELSAALAERIPTTPQR